MCLLTKQQISLITVDVENQGINFSHLSADLIDHICCDIESYMDSGILFNEAYSQVKQKFDIKGLRQIQHDTLMLIDKNYRIMKNSMKMIGVLALALMAFGALFKIGHWPGASFMLTLSFFFTTLVFYPTLLYVVYKEVNEKKQAIIYVIAFISGALFMTGTLFKIQHWPGASLLFFLGVGIITFILIPLILLLQTKTTSINKATFTIGLISLMIFLSGMVFKMQHWPGASFLLTTGSVFLVLVFVPLYYVNEVRKSEKIRVDFIFGTIAITHFIVFSFLLSISNSSGILIDINYQEKSFDLTANYLDNSNKKLINNNDIELVTQLSEQANLIYNQITDIKIIIVQNENNVSKEEAIYSLNTATTSLGAANMVNYLLSENNNKQLLIKLKADIDNFKDYYNNIIADSLQKNSKINQLLNTSAIKSHNSGIIQSWEDYHFYDIPPSIAINKLTLFQYNIRLAENRALSALVINQKNP